MSEREACAPCLRRGALIGRLAGRIAGLLQRRGRRPAGLLELSDQELVAALGGERTEELRRWIAGFEPERTWSELDAAGLDCVCRHSPAYPAGLRDLPDPPAVLYLAGSRERLRSLVEQPAVTVVGGRSATPYALEVAAALGRGLSAAGITVVSGLALGIDAAAHRGALRAGRRAIAVLASGADVPYPPSHRDLYARVRAHGAVLSELPPGTQPMRWSFPARNRIMAALGRLTVVVEAARASGSLITAAFAGDLGRDVVAVPGRVTTGRAAGSNELLRDGARVIRGAEDVLEELFGVGLEGAAAAARRLAADAAPAAAEGRLEPSLRRVLQAVEAGHRVDSIGREAGLPAGDVRAALGRLELLGLVARDGLGLYERTAGEPRP